MDLLIWLAQYAPQLNESSASSQVEGDALVLALIINAILLVPAVIGLWGVFKKAGKPGWAALVPIYNMVVLHEIVGRPAWWVVLYFVPLASFVVSVLVAFELAISFGKGNGMGLFVALFPFIAFPVLGFGNSVYQGPVRTV